METDQVEVVEQTESSQDNQEVQDSKQSNEASETQAMDKPFKDSFGNTYTAEEFQAKFDEFQGNFTKKAQEAADYKKQLEQRKASTEADARSAVDGNEALKDVPQEVREAIIGIVQPILEERDKQKEEARQEEEAQKAFKKELDDLEKRYDGKNGLPKFDRNTVLNEMKKPTNRIYDPEAVYNRLHQAEIRDWEVKQALTKQRGGNETETTVGDHNKPDTKTPKTWAESRAATYARFASRD